jgi:hypothetical protein
LPPHNADNYVVNNYYAKQTTPQEYTALINRAIIDIKERKIQILKLIVEEYLKTGEIMGSKNLLKKYDLQVSSAVQFHIPPNLP